MTDRSTDRWPSSAFLRGYTEAAEHLADRQIREVVDVLIFFGDVVPNGPRVGLSPRRSRAGEIDDVYDLCAMKASPSTPPRKAPLPPWSLKRLRSAPGVAPVPWTGLRFASLAA